MKARGESDETLLQPVLSSYLLFRMARRQKATRKPRSANPADRSEEAEKSDDDLMHSDDSTETDEEHLLASPHLHFPKTSAPPPAKEPAPAQPVLEPNHQLFPPLCTRFTPPPHPLAMPSPNPILSTNSLNNGALFQYPSTTLPPYSQTFPQAYASVSSLLGCPQFLFSTSLSSVNGY